MKALYFDAHGGTEVLQYGDVPDPHPGPGQALIQIKASSLNFNDIWARQGMPGMSVPLPHISGTDASGIVVALGAGVQHLPDDHHADGFGQQPPVGPALHQRDRD